MRDEIIKLDWDGNNEFIGKKVYHFDTIDSTSDYAKVIANDELDGTVVISEEQTKGRGRMGRRWESKSGDGIWMSVILKPSILPQDASFITLIAGATLVEVLNEIEIKASIKWPNDIIINNRKVSGILTEMSAEIDKINYIVLGIGINIKNEDFPEEISEIATSLKKEGYDVCRTDLVKRFLHKFEELYKDYVEKNKKSSTINIHREKSEIIGKDIYILNGKNKDLVRCAGISNDGNLIIDKGDGNIMEIISGEVSIRGVKGYV